MGSFLITLSETFIWHSRDLNNKEIRSIHTHFISLYKLRWTPLLKDFLLNTSDLVESLVFKIDEKSFNMREPLTLLKVYLELEMHDAAGKWLEQILLTMVPNEDLKLKDKVEFLFVAFLLHQDIKVLDFLPDLRYQIQSSQLPELQAYKSFSEGIAQTKIAPEAIIRILELKKELSTINPQLKVKVLAVTLIWTTPLFLVKLNWTQKNKILLVTMKTSRILLM